MHFLRNSILFLFSILFFQQLSAQDKYVDSLRNCFFTNSNVKNRLDAVINLSGNFIGQNHFDSAFHYIDLAIPMAQNDSLQDQLASLYSNRAIGHVFQGSNSQGLNSIMKSMQISEKLKDSTSLINDYNIIGIIQPILSCFFISLHIEMNNPNNVIVVY